MDDAKKYAHWKRMRFKRNKVYVAVDAQTRPIIEKSKVLIKYQLDQKHQYWVHSKSVFPLDETPPESKFAPPFASAPVDPAILKKAIRIYTDGACSGNPGPAGIGVVMQFQQHEKEISQYIGTATNNIAELDAIRVGLRSVKNKDLPVVVFTDSSYALGLLAKGWKATKNRPLVKQIKELSADFKNLRFVKIKGHAGHPENERADRLAVEAIEKAVAKEKQY
jgi:ribonuclease HI